MRTSMITTSMLGLAFIAAGAAMPASAAPQYYGSSGDTIRCESTDGRTRECATDGGRVVLERQISSSACIERLGANQSCDSSTPCASTVSFDSSASRSISMPAAA